jgi:hypothetical protein
MTSKKERKASKQPRNGKKPAPAGPALKSHKPEARSKRTIKQVIIETIGVNNAATNDEMIAAVKAEFPKSAFDGRHAAWYRSQARKGLLTGAAVTIPAMGRKQSKTAE